MSDQTGFDTEGMISNSKQIKNEEKNPPLTPLGTDDSNNYNSSANHSNITVRVCSDCHTTKTPLWRSGPKGPKVYISCIFFCCFPLAMDSTSNIFFF